MHLAPLHVFSNEKRKKKNLSAFCCLSREKDSSKAAMEKKWTNWPDVLRCLQKSPFSTGLFINPDDRLRARRNCHRLIYSSRALCCTLGEYRPRQPLT